MVFKHSLHAMKDMDIFKGISETRGPSDFDLIEEIITEEGERSRASLPRPPAPHADLLCQPHSQNHRMPSQSPPVPSQPVLVARGTACQPNCTFPQPQQQSRTLREMAHSSRGAASPTGTSRRGRGSKSSGCISTQSRGDDIEMLERLLNKPKLVVVEEPKERGMRFRYECEGRSAGSILGASSTETNKSQPTIEIQGPIDHLKRATVTVSLVTKDPPHRPHPHCLVGKDCPNGSGICRVTLNPHSNRRHSFANLGVQCVRRKELDVSLEKRRSQNIDPFQTGHSKGIEDMDMNAVRLCFECELEWDDGRKDCLSPVLSNPVYDKSHNYITAEDWPFNQYRGSCTGKTEIYMLCDKVQKDDIEIIFRKGPWKASGEFAQTDVHRQIAIVFKTPPYQDQDITEEVEVSVVLRRLSDQMESESVTFTYLPHNPDPYEVKRKRKIKSDISFRDKPCVTAESAPAAEQPFHFPEPQTMTPPDERPCAAQPGSSILGAMCYNEPQDSDNGTDETAIFNQLLEMPALLDIIFDPSFSLPSGFEQGPDPAFANMDINSNQNFNLYAQDFSHYNYSDLQFNMLVNESQTLQPEAQDNASNMVQVKTEEEL